ncbi:MAG: tyrosine-type recombinase/integrase [Bacteroidota bacterium]
MPDTATNYANYLKSKGHTSSTVKSYGQKLWAFLEWCEQHDIVAEATTHQQLIAFIEYLKTQHHPIMQKSVKIYLLAMSHYFDWVSTTQQTNYNPVLSLKYRVPHEQKLHSILERQQLDALYHHYPIPEQDTTKTLNARRDKVITGLVVFQGLTTIDLTHLTTDHLLLREGKLHIPPAKKSDGRTLDLKAAQIMDIMEYVNHVRPQLLTIRKKPSDKLLISTGSSDQLHNTLAEALKQLKILDPAVTSFKQLRASVITGWIRQHNLREAQYRAGHRYISSTEAYQKNDIADLQQDIDRLHPL